jgi:high-affinity nickel-transport protein
MREAITYNDMATVPVLELITSSGLGSLLGMRHALEPDHLAAVSTLVTRERSGYRAALVGACWGLGHTLSLLSVGVVLVVLRAEMTTTVAEIFELGVAVMLIGLGCRAVRQAARQGSIGPAQSHHHGHLTHTHAGVTPHVHVGRLTLARRPLLVGAVHGLAGSGALTALVLATLPTTAARLTYIALFGLGSTIGMAALSGLLGWPISRLGANQTFGRGVSAIVGVLSIGLGVAWAYPLLLRLL